jgi:uncharacterized protein (DUF2236 family)
MPARAVSAGDLELLLADIRKSTPNPQLGLFGPGSVNWKINRESALFLAAGRAALLQLAHPWVAAAIAQHSRTLQNPIGRFHNTFRVMFTISFGSLDQAFAAARRLYRLHETIRGTLPQTAGRFAAGSSYQANEVEALTWVFATLVDSALLAYDLALPPLSTAERQQYYLEGLRSIALFGISAAEFPADLPAFQRYMQSTLQSEMLGVGAQTRELAHGLQAGVGLPMRVPYWYSALTTQLLPPRFREEFQFSYGERQGMAADRAVRWVRRIYPRLPAGLRFVGPYLEIQSRLRGRLKPSLSTRISNRVWIGKPTLFQGTGCDVGFDSGTSSLL